MPNIDLTQQSVEELKSLGYSIMKDIEMWQRNLSLVDNEIARRNVSVMPKPAVQATTTPSNETITLDKIEPVTSTQDPIINQG